MDPPTEEQKLKARAQRELDDVFMPDLYDHMAKGHYHLDAAGKVIVRAQGLPGADYTMLQNWAKGQAYLLAPLFDVLHALEDDINHCHPEQPTDYA